MKPILEICCADIDSVRAAVAGGADRIELCCALSEGGLTPSYGQLCDAMRHGIAVNVLIRARGGDFVYNADEVRAMIDDIRMAVDMGVNGVVIGALTPDGDVDIDAVGRMAEAAKGVHITFHRAFDVCREPFAALEEIVLLGCDTLLTSGQKADALAGAGLLAQLHSRAAGRIAIMAGCGVTPLNAAEILRVSGADALHGSASTTLGNRRKTTDLAKVKALRKIIDNIPI